MKEKTQRSDPIAQAIVLLSNHGEGLSLSYFKCPKCGLAKVTQNQKIKECPKCVENEKHQKLVEQEVLNKQQRDILDYVTRPLKSLITIDEEEDGDDTIIFSMDYEGSNVEATIHFDIAFNCGCLEISGTCENRHGEEFEVKRILFHLADPQVDKTVSEWLIQQLLNAEVMTSIQDMVNDEDYLREWTEEDIKWIASHGGKMKIIKRMLAHQKKIKKGNNP
jgi:hypothetical protein